MALFGKKSEVDSCSDALCVQARAYVEGRRLGTIEDLACHLGVSIEEARHVAELLRKKGYLALELDDWSSKLQVVRAVGKLKHATADHTGFIAACEHARETIRKFTPRERLGREWFVNRFCLRFQISESAALRVAKIMLDEGLLKEERDGWYIVLPRRSFVPSPPAKQAKGTLASDEGFIGKGGSGMKEPGSVAKEQKSKLCWGCILRFGEDAARGSIYDKGIGLCVKCAGSLNGWARHQPSLKSASREEQVAAWKARFQEGKRMSPVKAASDSNTTKKASRGKEKDGVTSCRRCGKWEIEAVTAGLCNACITSFYIKRKGCRYQGEDLTVEQFLELYPPRKKSATAVTQRPGGSSRQAVVEEVGKPKKTMKPCCGKKHQSSDKVVRDLTSLLELVGKDTPFGCSILAAVNVLTNGASLERVKEVEAENRGLKRELATLTKKVERASALLAHEHQVET